MKRFLIPLALAITLVVPAQATAKKGNPFVTRHYVATVSPSGSLGFNVIYNKRHPKRKRVDNFSYSIPLNCADGPRTEFFLDAATRGRLNQGHFDLTTDLYVLLGGGSVVHSTLQISGTLSAGTIHRFGRILAQDGSGTFSDCDSGVLNWTAHRG